MRATLLLSTLAIASLAVAQQPQGDRELEVWEAYQNLRTNDSLTFRMQGTDVMGRVGTAVRSVMYWRLSNDPRTGRKNFAQVELDVFRDDVPTLRIVGDGTTLYRYDLIKREVSTTTYGYFGQKEPANFPGGAAKLLKQLRAVTPSHATYLARLLSEINPSGVDGAARFASWDPGTLPLDFDQAWTKTTPGATTALGTPKKRSAGIADADELLDPLTDAPYVRGKADRSHWFFYRVEQDRPLQTMAVHVVDNRQLEDDPPLWQLDSWRIAKTTPGRLVDLTIDVRPDAAPDWAYLPYGGAQGAAFRPVTRGN